MLRLGQFFCILLFLSGCSNSILSTGEIAENNTIDMVYVKKGMSSKDVIDIMGNPYKTKTIVQDSVTYAVWFYVTEGTVLGQTGYYPSNFTPFIFQNDVLTGWGSPLYRELFEQNSEPFGVKGHIDNPDDWPRNEHILIMPETENEGDLQKELAPPVSPSPPISPQNSNNQKDSSACKELSPSAWWE